MVFLLDSDAVIKLNRTGALLIIAEHFPCVVADAMFHEVVTRGKEIHRPEAEKIEAIIGEFMAPGSPSASPESRFGAGETEVLALYQEMQSDRNVQVAGSPVIVSDDRSFLAHAYQQGYDAITPADLIILTALQRWITERQAKDFLESLRPMTSKAAYQQALDNLEEWI